VARFSSEPDERLAVREQRVAAREQPVGEVRADEAGAAGDQDVHAPGLSDRTANPGVGQLAAPCFCNAW
jgi:hypothetical protein